MDSLRRPKHKLLDHSPIHAFFPPGSSLLSIAVINFMTKSNLG